MITENQLNRAIIFNAVIALALLAASFLSMFAVTGGNTIVTYSATGSTLQPTDHKYNPLEQMGIALIVIILNCSSAGLLLFIFLVWIVGNAMLFNVELESVYIGFPKIKNGIVAAYRAYIYERNKP